MGKFREDISEYLIAEDVKLIEVMDKLEKADQKILFVHHDNELRATVTDGDIRRWILNGGELDEPVQKAANYHPIFINEDQKDLAIERMEKMGLDAVPVVDKKKEIKKIYFLDGVCEKLHVFEKNIPVVIMAGGEGSRLSPYTKILPKPLIPIGELPIAEHIINQFRKYGCSDFKMIINYKRNMIKAYFNELNKDYLINYVSEDKPLGTGGGLSLLKGNINTTFILTNCDILINDDFNEIYQYHKNAGNVITLICSIKNFTIPYGTVSIGANGNIKALQEKPNMLFYINTGCYFVEPEVIEDLEYNKRIDFPEIMSKYIIQGRKVGAYPIGESMWLDMGQIDGLETMKKRLGY